MDSLIFSLFAGVWLAALVGVIALGRSSKNQPGGKQMIASSVMVVTEWLGYNSKSEIAVPVIIIRRGRGNTYGMDFGFFNGAGFLENMVAWRRTAIEGRLGGGKTLLSVALAKWLFETGKVRGVFSNFPISQHYIPYVPSCINTAVILDEGNEWADARTSGKTWSGYGKFFRKLGSYLLTPSVDAVDRRMRHVVVERNLDLFLFSWWLYNWKDPRGSRSWFIFSGFESVFDKYNHAFIPADDGGISETLKYEISRLAGSQRQILLAGEQEQMLELPYANPLGVGDGRTVR